MNIYVGNLSYEVTENDMKTAFSEFGEVTSANIIKDKFSGQSKGFGFVEMPNNSEADKAIKSLNGTDLKGRNIKVNQAKPRGERERPARKPRY
jgi:RNA recognition motif-containing protein